MSSRDDIWNFINANWTATPIYALDDIMSIDDLPATAEEPVLMIDFPSALERFTTIAVHNCNGWREDGSIQLIMAHPIGKDGNITRGYCEDLRDLIRGRRLGETVIQAVDSFSSVGQHDGKWQLYVSLAGFYRDACH